MLVWILLFSIHVRAQRIHTFAGNGVIGYSDGGGMPLSAEFNHPWGLAFDKSGHLYIADHVNSAIRKVSSSGVISTFAGTTTCGYGGDGGRADSAMMQRPASLAFDAAGNLLIADGLDHRIRKIDTTGIIFTIAGNGIAGYSGDGGAATAATFNTPTGIAADASGNIYVADSGNNVIRKIAPSGIISTFAGTGTGAYSGDGGPANAATLFGPVGVTVDAAGNVFIADQLNNVIRKVNTSGVISTFAGTGVAGFSGDNGSAAAAQFTKPNTVAFDALGNAYITDEHNHRLRRVSTEGVVATVAGVGSVGYSGDGGQAIDAQLFRPMGIAIAGDKIYIGDYINSVVRVVNMDRAGVDVQAKNQAALHIYPVPAYDRIQVEIGTSLQDNVQLEMQDLLGNRLYEATLKDKKALVNIAGLPPGCYYVACYHEGVRIASARFIKQ
ncbi:MAG: repeat containing protein [Flavipsychrobacter sp.]|nr:repeat containing protein [Flavipsychrobacter sp.]